MKPTIYYIITRIFSTFLAVVAIFLQFYVLLDLETQYKTEFDSSVALSVSIYISLLLCVISLSKTIKAVEQYNERSH